MNRVFHIISSLGQGGAETVLYRLCLNTDRSRFEHTVVSLTTSGIYGNELMEAGVKVHCLQIKNWKTMILASCRLYRLLKTSKPTIVQTWMYHSDLFGGIISRLVGVNHVVWNIRGPLNIEKTCFRTLVIAKFSALCSNFIPTSIVCVSDYALKVHVRFGYNASKFILIPNGYSYSHERHKEICFKIKEHSSLLIQDPPLIGMVARFDPFKDHENLLRALSYLIGSDVSFKCLLIGEGLDDSNFELTSYIKQYGLEKVITLLGYQKDTFSIFESLDIHVLSSLDEAFPNVLAESMASGTPCVTTDVGDASVIVGTTGWIVPPRDSLALAEAIKIALSELHDKNWLIRQRNCIDRIKNNFGIEKMQRAYETIWSESSHN